jgi:hypothetical protein
MKERLSIIDQSSADCEAFLFRYRRAYLRSVGGEIGISDLRDLALREAAAMIEVVQELDAAALRVGRGDRR